MEALVREGVAHPEGWHTQCTGTVGTVHCALCTKSTYSAHQVIVVQQGVTLPR